MASKNIKLDENMLRKNRVPLLFNEPSWVKLFGDTGDKSIQKQKEELILLVSKEKEISAKNRKLQKEKLESMKMILGISDSVNNENKIENIVLLDEYKDRIFKINQELEELTFQQEIMPKEIRESNFRLLNATIQYGYDELRYKEKIVNQSTEEIETLRQRLKGLMETKYDYEEWINETYTFLHGVLGSEVIEKIDKERLK